MKQLRVSGSPAPRAPARLALQALTPEALTRQVPGVLLAEARQIVAMLHSGRDFTAPHPSIRRSSREAVAAAAHVPELAPCERVQSSYDAFLKLLLRTPDARLIECVRIPLEHPQRFSACVSSQVGCALACAFCATGRLGLGRNLETWEIVEQVRQLRATLDGTSGERIHGVVFQGMGEPLANLDRVIEAIAVLSDPSALAIDARNITVSTAGLPAGMRRLAREVPRTRLAWSIGSAIAEKRARLMPISLAHPLEEAYDACVEHARVTGLAPLWAVTLLAGENDSNADALALAALARRFMDDAGRAARISIIPYNAIGGASGEPFQRASAAAEWRFREVLRDAGIFTHRRYSGGGDVGAACGQLAAKG